MIYSIFKAEMFATLQALSFILNNNINNASILSYAKAALEKITGPILPIDDNLIQETRLAAVNTTALLNSKLVWIPGRKGIQGNEYVD